MLIRLLFLPRTGELEPLFTQEVPCSSNPEFSATARHAFTLGPGQSLASHFAGASPDPSALLLKFELWDKWPAGGDTLCAAAELNLSGIVSQAQRPQSEPGSAPVILGSAESSHELPLAFVKGSAALAGADSSPEGFPTLKVHVGYLAEEREDALVPASEVGGTSSGVGVEEHAAGSAALPSNATESVLELDGKVSRWRLKKA